MILHFVCNAHVNEFIGFRRRLETEPNALLIHSLHEQQDNTSYLCFIHMTTCDFDVERRACTALFLLQPR